MKLICYNDSPIKNSGSITVVFYHGSEKYKVLCEVADSSGHMILDRNQAPRMNYIDFAKIQVPTVNVNPGKTIKAVQEEHVRARTELVRPFIQQSLDSSITITGKTHQLSPQKDTC